jgi:hypothetical protein
MKDTEVRHSLDYARPEETMSPRVRWYHWVLAIGSIAFIGYAIYQIGSTTFP